MNQNLQENNKVKRKDRVLGDEWKEWDESKGSENLINENKRTFFIFSFLVIALIIALSGVIFYMITPRLNQISLLLSKIIAVSTLLLCSIMLAWYLCLIIAVSTGKALFFSRGINRVILTFLIDKTSKLGIRFGVSKDRMANSFLKVFNRIIESGTKSMLPLKPLIILPRCLTKDIKEKTKELSLKYDLKYYIVAGGEAALAKVRDEKPGAVIGVACERDLLGGIRELKGNLPVLAIANRRPHGPCKDTDIDIGELERAIRYFLQV